MEENNKKQFVIALGGSAVYPDKIDIEFLKKFRDFIFEKINAGYKFAIIIGGGKLCRQFQLAAAEVANVAEEDKDWIGIHSTRLNAHLLRTIFREAAHPVLFKERFKIKDFGGYSVIIGTGWKPGNSSDFVAIQIAVDLGINNVLILGKPDYVYTADFEKDSNARPLEKISWQDYMELIPAEWNPGMSSPVDPVAARLAEKEKLKVIVANAKDLENVGKILEGKEFKGTILE